MRALILEDGYSRQALSGSRALAAAGWEVGVGAALGRGLAASSRSTSHDHRVPAPGVDLDGFVEAVNAAISTVGYDLVFGARDVEVLALSSRRDTIDAEVPHPPHNRVVRALDKLELTDAARRAGIAVPRTIAATDDALAQVEGPTIVKARLHAQLDGLTRPPRIETALVGTPAEAAQRAAEIRSEGGEPLLQEALSGCLEEVAVVADRDGRLVAQAHQTVQRLSSRTAGVAVRATTVAPDRELLERVETLVEDLGWWGLVELQFIVPPGGDHHLIDFNGRFYGSMALAVAAGVNLPAAWASVASRTPVDHMAARPGVRYQWATGDARSCLAEASGNRLPALLQCARWAPGAVQSVFAPRDPLPAWRNLTLDMRNIARKRLPGRG